MASLRVLAFDHEGRPIQFDTWLDDLQLYLLSDSRDSVSLFDHTSGAAPAPPAIADSATRSQWLTRDAAARLAIRNHLPLAECAHFGQHRTAQAMYDAIVTCYSSPATATLGRLLLPYLFPELSAFATVEDLVSHLRASNARYRAAAPADFLDRNQPPMFITLYFIVTRDSIHPRHPHSRPPPPTDPPPPTQQEQTRQQQRGRREDGWGNMLGRDGWGVGGKLWVARGSRVQRVRQTVAHSTGRRKGGVTSHLLVAETSVVAVDATYGTPRTPFFEGCSPSPLAPSYASAAAVDVLGAEDVGAASASAKRRSSKGKGGRGGGGGSGSGGGGSSGGSGGSGGGGSGGSGGGGGGVGGGGGGSGGSDGSGSGGSGGGRNGSQRGGSGGGQRQQ
ncbi:unnamed protein product [Closterium sp. NIES-54]